MANVERERFEFLYDYAAAVLARDVAIFESLETKTSRFATLLTIVVASYTALLRFSPVTAFPATVWWDWVICALVVLSYVAIAAAWGHAMQAMRLTRTPRLSFGDYERSIITEHNLSTSKNAFARTCREAHDAFTLVLNKKTRALQLAYDDTVLAAWLLSGTLLAMVLKVLVDFPS